MICGATRTGKSTLARALFLTTAAPRLVIDPNDSSLTTIDGAVTFRTPSAFPLDAATARFVPVDPADRDAYNEVYRIAFEHFPRYTWLDEPDQAAPASGFPRWANTYVAQGAKRMLGHLTCTTSLRWIMRSLIRNAAHVFAFQLPSPDDRRYLADLAGIPPAVLEAELAAIGPHGFTHWDQEARTLRTYTDGLVIR